MPDEDDIADVLNSVDADDIIAASRMGQEQRIFAPALSREALMSAKTAFNNPGSGTAQVTTSIIDDADISMRSHGLPGGGTAEWDDEFGNTHSGPKWSPGEKRKRQDAGLSGTKPKAVNLKLDECVLVRANVEARDSEVSIYVVNGFHGLAFRVTQGPLGNQVLYVLDGDLYDGYAADGIPSVLGLQIDPDEEGNGWVLGGARVNIAFLQQFVHSIRARVARNQLT